MMLNHKIINGTEAALEDALKNFPHTYPPHPPLESLSIKMWSYTRTVLVDRVPF